MSKSAVDMPPKGGFSFDICRRNEMLMKKGANPPSFKKTGTTIVGIVFKESVKAEEEQEVNGSHHAEGGNSKSIDMRTISGKKKSQKKILKTAVPVEESNKSDVKMEKSGIKKRKHRFLEESSKCKKREEINRKSAAEEAIPWAENGEREGKKETAEGEEAHIVNGMNPLGGNLNSGDKMADNQKNKKKLLMEAAEADKRGVCYLSRIPPHMDHVKLRHILSQYGEIQRIYLAPEDPTTQVLRKRAGGFRGQGFSEGWVEFANKSVAKRTANILNGEQIGGRKRSQFYYDLWNIKYLSKFKWDDLTEEIAYKSAIREQKLTLEISAAKRERDFYLSKVDQSRALSSIEERIKKRQKVQQGLGAEVSVGQAPKVIRQFPQKKPVVDKTEERKPQLSKDILAGVFGGS